MGIANTCLMIQKPYIEGVLITSPPWFIGNKNVKHEEGHILFYGHKACAVKLLKKQGQLFYSPLIASK
jgi:hypothetical protein